MKKFYGVALALGLSLISTYAVAGRPDLTLDALVTDGPSESKAFVGLNWSLGESVTPELILGLANGKTKVDGKVQGSKIAIHIDIASGFTLSKVKATALYGKADAMGELGGGYNFSNSELIGVVGLNTRNLAVGVDINMDMEFSPYVDLNTIGAFPGTSLSCDGLPDTYPGDSELQLIDNGVPNADGACLYEIP